MPKFSSDVRPLMGVDDLIGAGLQHAYLKWNEARGDAIGPATVDLLELAEVIDCCAIIDLKAGKPVPEATIRFAGSSLVNGVGAELTGLPVLGFERYPMALKLVFACAEGRIPVAAGPHSVAFKPLDFQVVEHICLPLSQDGKVLTGFLYAFSHRVTSQLLSQGGDI